MRALIFALVLPACGPDIPMPSRTLEVARPLTEYVWAFEREWGQQVVGIDVQLVPDVTKLDGATPLTVGLCSQYMGDFWQVSLDARWWEQASEACREALMFHELGHCALGRGHVKETYPDGRPVSVMFPNLAPVCAVWPSRRQEYVNEAFGRE